MSDEPTHAPDVSRHQVVQAFVDLFAEPRYLEVGVNEGATFNAIRASAKVAVDPAFAFEWQSAQSDLESVSSFHEVTSDEYFGTLVGKDERFHVVYLDGLHTFEQTLRDLINAIAVLAPDGIVVIDDVRPTSYHASLPDQLEFFAVRERVADPDWSWMGDVYKLIWFIDTFFQQLSWATVSNNHGQTVVWNERRNAVTERDARAIADLAFKDVVLGQDVLRLAPLADIVRRVVSARSRVEQQDGYA